MASQQFIDPLVALRAAPLISATCSLSFAWDQHFFLRLLNEPGTRENSKAMLSTYFPSFFRHATPYIVVLLSITMGTTIANLYIRPASLIATESTRWYKAGAIFAFGHLLFVPFVASSVKDIHDQHGDNNNNLDRWLRVNAIRGLTVDLAAWVTFAIALSKVFSRSLSRV